MKSVAEIAAILEITPQRLQYWLNKEDAPGFIYEYRRGHMVKCYDSKKVQELYNER